MKDTALHIPILGRGDKVKRIIILLGLMIISCEKSYHNPDDPTKLNYWVNYYIHGTILRNNVFPPPAPPTSIVASNGTTHLVFYLNTATTSAYLLARNTSANSFIAMSALPEGITLNSSTGVFSGTPTSLLSPTQINFKVCNSVGCATAEFTVRVINVRGTRVYGQGGDFTTSTSNKGGISADSLASPGSVVVDSSGGVYIADNVNSRVLFYSGGSTTATRVYGQGGSFTTATSGTSSTTFGFSLIALALDSSGGLYVGDSSNHRV